MKPLDRTAALQQPAHDWARHHCARGHIGHCSRRRLDSRGYRSQPRNRLMLKHRTRRDHHTRLARAAHQLDRDDAVASEREEIVLNPNSLDPQNLRKQPAQNLLTRRARRAKTTTTNRRRRQRSTVKLPVRRQRKMIKLDYRRWHHVLRKPRSNMRAQLPSINRTPSRRHHIANKLRAPRPLSARNHRRLRHTRVTTKRRLDLPRLNAETAHLHLMVRATHKLQNSIQPPPRQVPAAVHPRPRSAKPVRNKTLPSKPTATDIAPANPSSGDVKLPNYPNSHRLQAIIQYVNAQIRDPAPDQTAPAANRKLPVQANMADMHRRLGDAVHVDQHGGIVGAVFIPILKSPEVQRFTAKDDMTQGKCSASLPVLPLRLQQVIERRRGLVEDRDPLARNQPQELPRRAAHRIRHDHQSAAVQKRTPYLPHREVEGERVE